MAIKGDDERDGIVLVSVGDRLADDLLVAEMDAVEDANGQTDFAAGGRKFGSGVDGSQR